MAIRAGDVVTTYTGDLRDLERASRRAPQLVEESARRINRSLGSMGSGGGSGGGFGFGAIGQTLKMLPGLGQLASALGTVTDAMQEGIRFGFDYNRTVEENRLAFTRLLGGREQAEKYIQTLQRLRREGIGLAEAGASSRRFQAARFDLQQIPLYISAVGDAARFTGAEVDAITRALTQMASKGRVSAEEVNQQLAEQGIPAWRYLADAVAEVDKNFDKLTDEQRIARVQKMAERGMLSGMGGAQAILRGIQKDFGGFSREFADSTATGIEGQLEAVASRLAGTATGPFFERYKSLLRGVLDVANSETGEALARGAAGASNNFFIGLDKAITEGGNIGAGLIQGVGTTGFQMAVKVWGDFKAGIGSNSPATKFIPLGISAAEGFQIGFRSQIQSGGGVMGLFQGGRGPLSPGVTRYDSLIERIAREVGVDPNLIRAVMQQESGGRGVTSHAGAQGPMQLMPGTARRFGVSNPFDPEQAIRGGAQYLRWLSDRYGGNLDKTLAGYNAGEGNVDKYGGIPPFRETQNYVRSVRGIYGRLGPRPMGSMSVEEQQQLLWMMAERMGLWGAGRHRGAGDLTGGVGVFADGFTGGNFRDVPEGSGLDDMGPIIARLQGEIENVTVDAVKFTQVFNRPLIPFPGAEEGVDALNGRIQQTVSILQKTQDASRFLGAEVRDIAGATQGSLVEFFSSTEGGFKGMAGRMVLAWSQSVSQMIIEAQMARLTERLFGTFDTSGKSQGGGWLGKLLGWGAGAVAGGFSFGGGGNFGGAGAGGGFAQGGSFMVGGPAGVDRTPVSFFASRGERVTVETPAQQQRTARSDVRPPIRIHYAPVFYANPQTGRFSRQSAEQAARLQLDILNHAVERGG